MNIIKDKIDKFIRKYYTSQILTGFIILSGILLLLFLISSVVEYYTWLDAPIRSFIFWSIIIVCSLVFIALIAIPLFKLLRLGRIISYSEAAKIIGRFFPEIKDKLLNFLQLEEMQGDESVNSDLIVAGINQKIENLKPFNYAKAVDFRSTLKWLKFVAPVLVIFIAILIAKPSVIKQPAQRIINYNTQYTKPQPFYLNLMNDKLNVVQNDNFTVYFSVSGVEKPENVIINFSNSSNSNKSDAYMNKVCDSVYSYTFKSVQRNISFFASADNITSPKYEVEVYPLPTLLGFNLSLRYPEYTGKNNETIENTGIIKILYGTSGIWTFSTKDADGLLVIQEGRIDTVRNDKGIKSNDIKMNSYFSVDTKINVIAFNKYLSSRDTLTYQIQIINDLSPDIQVVEANDTIMNRDLFFSGTISDDYGFSSLKFYYRIIHSDFSESNYWSQVIPIDNNSTIQQFFWRANVDEIGVMPGEGVEYYFEVCDNDVAKGYKCSQSQTMSYNRMTIEQMDEISERVSEAVKDNLDDSMEKMSEINRQIEDFLRELKEKDKLSFQDKEKLENMLKQQKEMKEKIEEQREQMQMNNFNQNEYNEFSDRVLEKQRKIEELYNKILNEDMKKMIEEIEKMLEDFNKDKLDPELRDYQAKNEDIEKQLDKTLELYKNLEFEQEFEKTMNKLDSLAKEQEELAKKTENSNKEDMEKLKDAQKKINDEFEKAKEDFDKLEQMNNDLEKKLDINFENPKIDDIEKNLEDASEKLDKKKKDAAKNQDDAAQDMKSLSEEMRKQFEDATYEQAEEDEALIRRLLENIIHLSFKEEDLIEQLQKVKRGNPKYIEIIYKQGEINTQLGLVEDSLNALARRNFQVSSFIFNELDKLKDFSEQSTKNLTDRNVYAATKNLQQTMSSLNVFALMLSESMDSMEEDMLNSSSCPNGKKKRKTGKDGQPSLQTMQQLQEQLKKQMEQMKQNQSKEGNASPFGKPGESEQFAKMAMQQEAIRRMLEELQKELRSEGQGLGDELQQAINAMEQTENDLINKRITDQMISRQQEILTRLLESEKAQKQRDQDKQRESKEGIKIDRKSPEEIFNINNDVNNYDDKLRTTPPNLNSYYKQKIDQYKYRLKQQ